MSLESAAYVARILTRNARGNAFPSEGRNLEDWLATAPSGFNGYLTLETPSASIARALLRDANLIHASYPNLEPRAALEELRRQTPQSRLTWQALQLDAMKLAQAAAAGRALTLGESQSVNVQALRSRLEETAFTGCMAFELGLNLTIWSVDTGRVSGEELPNAELRCRVTQLEWDGTPLPPLVRLEAAPEATSTSIFPPPNSSHSSNTERIWQAAERILRAEIGVGAKRTIEQLKAKHLTSSETEIVTALKKQLAPLGGAVANAFERALEEPRF
jgi:hypothetical protein